MSSAMDALKYSNYMSAAGHSMGLYPFSGQDGTGQTGTGQDQSKTGGYSADALSRSYLEQQKSYYESAGLKGYTDRTSIGQPTFDSKSYTPDSMSERQSTESPEIKKPADSLQQQQQAALQAYYAGGSTANSQTSLPPLLPMAAQLTQYGGGAGYPQTSPGTDYSRRPLSVLF